MKIVLVELWPGGTLGTGQVTATSSNIYMIDQSSPRYADRGYTDRVEAVHKCGLFLVPVDGPE